VIHQPEEVLAASEEWPKRTFTESGLFDKVRASTVTEVQAEEQILAYLKAQGVEERTALLAGNPINNDRRFLRAQMPRLHEWLHYRSIDVSTIKMLVCTWLPAIFEGVPAKAESHQAFADIEESIAELRYYQQHVFEPLAAQLPTTE